MTPWTDEFSHRKGTFLKGHQGSLAKEIILNLIEFASISKVKNVLIKED